VKATESKCASYHQQGHVPVKLALKNILVPIWGCRLTKANLHNGHKMLLSTYNNQMVNLASGMAYVGGRTGEGQTQVAGTDGRRAQTGCGRG